MGNQFREGRIWKGKALAAIVVKGPDRSVNDSSRSFTE